MPTLAEVVRQTILAHLAAQNGNRVRAAASLGISVRGLYNALAKYKAAGFAIPSGRFYHAPKGKSDAG